MRKYGKKYTIWHDDLAIDNNHGWDDVLISYELDHNIISEKRTYMAIMKGTGIEFIMLLFIWRMYGKKKLNFIIQTVSVIIFSTSL